MNEQYLVPEKALVPEKIVEFLNRDRGIDKSYIVHFTMP